MFSFFKNLIFFIVHLSAGARPNESPLLRKLHVGPPSSVSKMEGKGGFTQNAIFIRFCISCIFVRFLMNERNGYVFTQNAIASDFGIYVTSSYRLVCSKVVAAAPF